MSEITQYTRKALVYSTKKSAERDSKIVAYNLGLDMHTSTAYAEPRQRTDGKWVLPHPNNQSENADAETVARWMEDTDNYTVADWDDAWFPAEE